MILVFKMQYLAIGYLGLNTSMPHLCIHEYEKMQMDRHFWQRFHMYCTKPNVMPTYYHSKGTLDLSDKMLS